jgi:pimeloyl-ACP methyl ester carboxylesterase
MSAIAFKTLGGEGPDTVLIHGFGSDRLSWLGNSPALMDVSKVHALDLPGHGESSADVGDGSIDTLAARVAAALDHHGIACAHVVGHSLGGAVALVMAERRPDLIASLTLIAPAGLGQHIDPVFLEQLPKLDDLDQAVTLLRTLVARPPLINKLTAQRILTQLAGEGVREALAAVAAGLLAGEDRASKAAEAVAARGVRRIVLWGADDRINPLDQVRLDRFGGNLHVIAATGHLPHIENPKVANALMCDFITSVTAG